MGEGKTVKEDVWAGRLKAQAGLAAGKRIFPDNVKRKRRPQEIKEGRFQRTGYAIGARGIKKKKESSFPSQMRGFYDGGYNNMVCNSAPRYAVLRRSRVYFPSGPSRTKEVSQVEESKKESVSGLGGKRARASRKRKVKSPGPWRRRPNRKKASGRNEASIKSSPKQQSRECI